MLVDTVKGWAQRLEDTKRDWTLEQLQHWELKVGQHRNWDRAGENQFGAVMDSWAVQFGRLGSWKRREAVGMKKEEEQRHL